LSAAAAFGSAVPGSKSSASSAADAKCAPEATAASWLRKASLSPRGEKRGDIDESSFGVRQRGGGAEEGVAFAFAAFSDDLGPSTSGRRASQREQGRLVQYTMPRRLLGGGGGGEGKGEKGRGGAFFFPRTRLFKKKN